MSICIIFNPAARGEKAQTFRRRLELIKGSWTLKPTTGPGSARDLAAKAVDEGFSCIIAAGGDGTLNEVVNGIADVPGALKRVRLGVLPLGTINVFARELRLPLDLEKVWPILDAGSEIQVDLGLAEFYCKGRAEKRYFVQLAGAGWDARAVELVDWGLKKKVGPAAYVLAGLQALGSEHPPITISNGSVEYSGQLVIIGNGRFYGGNFPVFHKSDLQDGVLDAVVFSEVDWASLPGHLWDFLSGKLYKEGGSTYLQGAELFLTGKARAALQLEGEPVGELPARIRVEPRALRVISPSPGAA